MGCELVAGKLQHCQQCLTMEAEERVLIQKVVMVVVLLMVVVIVVVVVHHKEVGQLIKGKEK